MKHPNLTEWMTWLYGEASPNARLDFEAHLAVCPDCRLQVDQWRRTMGILDAAAVPKIEVPHARRFRPVLKGLAAAAAVLALGFFLGRQTGVNEHELQTRLDRFREEVRAQVATSSPVDLDAISERTLNGVRLENRALISELVRQIQDARDEDRAELFGTLRQVDQRRGAEIAQVRGGLTRLATHTGRGFEEAHNEMQLIAGSLSGGLQNSNHRTQEIP